MSSPRRTDYVIGDIDATALAANYQCGHCLSETVLGTDPDTNGPRLEIRHDDGCPVLVGALPSTPDVVRALAGHVPDTFRRP
ncbi:hypothetical protein O3Q52_19285 [Streptomyces sp. ActVer]|uniref:hypothetical protein n=1 Tax=Streptomyces sp. ActVer TaxID=3014558 RepID=UPI0022B2DBCC|nr:hypothetical protein [Streptomyces sp. ActVer]MCZ4510294.1 hypothetical protein [Streptomyces sp. ActVer]